MQFHISTVVWTTLLLMQSGVEKRPEKSSPTLSISLDGHDKLLCVEDSSSSAMKSFIPDTLLARLVENMNCNRPTDATSRSFEGVCLIVDISGFTRLSGAFCAQGKVGIDGLQKIVNGYMGLLVEIIYEYGGDVIKFAGDALICVFEPVHTVHRDVAMFRICLNALLCAWTLKDVCTSELTAHIAVGLGDICFGVLGGVNNRWEFLVSGPCMSQLSSCLDDAPSKHVALTNQFYAEIMRYLSNNHQENDLFTLRGRSLESSNVLVEHCVHLAPPIKYAPNHRHVHAAHEEHAMSGQVAAFVPQPVTQALAAGTFGFLAELREVTTVFIKWDGYSDIEHQDLLSLQKHFVVVQEVIAYSGGFLRQFLVDDKGCVLIAMWGVPAAAFPDNCMRALWATVTLCQKLGALGMPLSCGMTTGNVYCGTVGSPLRQEYAAVGDVVNLAARLMSKAKRTVYLDEASYDRLPELVQSKLTAMPEIMVKGKDLPIRPYKYIDMDDTFDFKDTAFDAFPIRTACRDVFEPLLSFLMSTDDLSMKRKDRAKAQRRESGAAVVSSGVRFVLIEGPSGTGKGRSLSWLKYNAEKVNIRCVAITLAKMDAVSEYSSLSKLFRLLIHEENFDNESRQTNMVNQLLQDIYPKDRETLEKVAYPSMRSVLGVTCPLRSNGKLIEVKKIRKMPARLIFQSMCDIFQALLAEQPVVITIENMQYMDEMSWPVVQEFFRFDAKAAIVVSCASTANSNSQSMKALHTDVFSTGSVPSFQWVDQNIHRLLNNKNTSHVVLNTYTFNEMKVFLSHCLNTRVNLLPKGLDTLVFQLSGANPLWVSEICEFIKSNGVQEFMNTMAPEETRDEKQGSRGGHRRGSGGNSLPAPSSHESFLSSATSFVNTAQSFVATVQAANYHTFAPQKPEDDRPEETLSRTPDSDKPTGFATPLVRRNSRNNILPPLATPPTPMSAGGSNFRKFPFIPAGLVIPERKSIVVLPNSDKPTTDKELGVAANNKLAFLIVCRFAKLTSDSQSVARSASIVGVEFTEAVLSCVIPASMKPKLSSILEVLVLSNWVTRSEAVSKKGLSYSVYSFIHPMVHQTIYDLTPRSVRFSVHFNIAKVSDSKSRNICDDFGFFFQFLEESALDLGDREDYLQGLAYRECTIGLVVLFLASFAFSASDYTHCDGQRIKAHEYLAKVALESIVSQHCDIDKALSFIQKSMEFVSTSVDASALIGILMRAKERYQRVSSTNCHCP